MCLRSADIRGLPSKFGESREGIFVCLRSVDIGGLPVNLVRAEREYLCV